MSESYAGAAGAVLLARPLELLERSLSYSRVVLAGVPGHAADQDTPCAGWDLADLLAHMVDGFTAFIQGATGVVPPAEPTLLPRDPALLAGHLLDLGCGVLSGWATAEDRDCLMGLVPLPADSLLGVAALEVAIHGWDVAHATGYDRQLPPQLAAGLLPLAFRHVRPADRPGRFAPVVATARRDPVALLLSHLGRSAG